MGDANDFMASYENHLKVLAEANTLNKTAVFDALIAAGIKTVTVNFNGEGDSGQIEEVVAYSNEAPGQIPATPIKLQSASWGNAKSTLRELPLSEAIEDLCYDYLSQEHGGWENNDGAYGEFTFHVEDRRIELDFNGRFTDSTNFSHIF